MPRLNSCAANSRPDRRAHTAAENAKIGASLESAATFERNEESIVEQAGSGLEKIVAQSLRQAPAAEAPLMAWPVVCGSAVAGRTRAVRFENGVLHVEVADAGWKYELQTLAPRYVAQINRYTSKTVRTIEFVVARFGIEDKNPR